VSKIKYLWKVVHEFSELIMGNAATPVADHLFNMRDEKEARALEKEQALAFHHTNMVAQVLFMSTRARQNIQTMVTFLMTRVENPGRDDWGKKKRVLKYLNGTQNLKSKLSINNLGMLKWYVGGSHNVYWDCKGHGGAVFTLGKGATLSYSRKVK
jgi:hypothetical protein